MRRKKSRGMAAALILMMLISMLVPTGKAQAVTYEPTIPKVSVSEMLPAFEAKPGEVIEIKLPVKASSYSVRNPIISLDLEKDGKPFELVSDFKFTRDDVKENTKITSLAVAKVTYITFSLKVKESARKGEYELGAMHFATTDSFNEYCSVDLIQPTPVIIKVTEEKKLPEMRIVAQQMPEAIKPMDEFTIDLDFLNESQLTIQNVRIWLEGYEESGFIPKKLYNTMELEQVKAGETVKASFAYTAAKSLGSGIKNLSAVVEFGLEDGTTFTKKTDFYLEAVGPDQSTTVRNSDVQLTEAVYPRNVKAEEPVEVRLKYTNKGVGKVTDVVVQLGDYSASGFIPEFLYDTVELKDLAAGASDVAVFKLTASKTFGAGTKTLTAKVTYTTDTGVTYDNTVSLYMEGESPEVVLDGSKPKLLIQDYDLGVEKLMAGSEFLFHFDVLNSHSTAKADNIKVTVSSADNTFSIIEGSASFLVSSIAPGESQACEIPLKVMGEAATGGYDLTITFDYEYAAKDERGNDVSKSDTLVEKLKIPVYSNDRPMVSNIMVGYWEMPRFNELTTMSFEFYNMGKSPLYNVTATVSGDFDSFGNMLMIGNVQPGSGKSWEMDVTPIVEGYGMGTLTISYEDSNGNVSSFDTTFESAIETVSYDPGVMDPGIWDDTMGMGDVVEPKKPLLPLWAFLLVQAGILVIVTPIVKSAKIKAYKKKELKRLEELDD